MNNLISALLKARSQFNPIRKDRVNPFFKSKYADLDSVIAATENALTANGLVVSQTTGIVDGTPVLITTLWHESGESLKGEYPLPKSEDPQKLGSAITYARRYALCAILGVTADDDTDGNSNSSTTPPQQQQTQKKAVTPVPVKPVAVVRNSPAPPVAIAPPPKDEEWRKWKSARDGIAWAVIFAGITEQRAIEIYESIVPEVRPDGREVKAPRFESEIKNLTNAF